MNSIRFQGTLTGCISPQKSRCSRRPGANPLSPLGRTSIKGAKRETGNRRRAQSSWTETAICTVGNGCDQRCYEPTLWLSLAWYRLNRRNETKTGSRSKRRVKYPRYPRGTPQPRYAVPPEWMRNSTEIQSQAQEWEITSLVIQKTGTSNSPDALRVNNNHTHVNSETQSQTSPVLRKL